MPPAQASITPYFFCLSASLEVRLHVGRNRLGMAQSVNVQVTKHAGMRRHRQHISDHIQRGCQFSFSPRQASNLLGFSRSHCVQYGFKSAIYCLS